jgi:hypothetical protein
VIALRCYDHLQRSIDESVEAYEYHRSEMHDVDGQPCGKQTLGLVQRWQVRIDMITAIGKESNS